MFDVIIWYNKKNQSGSIGIGCKNCRNVIGYTIQNKPLNKFITPFVINILFRNVDLAWIFIAT